MKIVRTRTSQKYIINGREYASLEEMPEAERQLFVAAQRAMESPDRTGPIKMERVLIEEVNGVTKFVVNGREYHTLEEVPEAERHLIEEASQSLKPAELAESVTTESLTVDEKKVILGSDVAGRSPARWTLTVSLSTLVWVLICVAIAVVAALLIAKGFLH